jgi:hypothetical protein
MGEPIPRLIGKGVGRNIAPKKGHLYAARDGNSRYICRPGGGSPVYRYLTSGVSPMTFLAADARRFLLVVLADIVGAGPARRGTADSSQPDKHSNFFGSVPSRNEPMIDLDRWSEMA